MTPREGHPTDDLEVDPDIAGGAPELDPDAQSGVVLLIWDAPNVDMGLGAILGARPTAAHRPRSPRRAAVSAARPASRRPPPRPRRRPRPG